MKVKNFKHLLQLAKEKDAKKVAVVAADDKEIIEVIEKAEKEGLANFILIGSENKIKNILKEGNFEIQAEIIDETDHQKAAEKAVDLVVEGKAGALMKGQLHSAIFLKAILNKEKGLNTGRHITQISLLEKDEEDGFLMITDCAISMEPDLMGKKEIIENAVDLQGKLGVEIPNVAILAALEIINPDIQDTLDAAILSKMAERGQIKGCIVDGPFAFDNAYSEKAAVHKGINSPVAGHADVLVVPSLAVGNSLSKSISIVAKKTVVAATVGAAIPVVFNSRTESIEGKLLSIALAAYVS